MDIKAIEAMARGLCDGSPLTDDTWQDYVPEATAALAAYHAHLKAEGFVIVPVEPDHLTTLRTHLGLGTFERYPNVEKAIRAMLSAAPRGGEG